MPLFVQYDEDGNITGTVSGNRPPPHPRQICFKDLPEEPTPPDATVYLDEYAPSDVHGHRLDRTDPAKPCLVPCPKVARERHNSEIDAKIRAVEARQPRAVREHLLTGDLTALDNIEKEIEELRKKRQV